VIILFTDFGLAGPYVGQMRAVLYRRAPRVPVVNLFADAPAHAPKLGAYLLAAYADEFASGAVFLAVIDPGVGGARAAAVVEADGRWFVGPQNGLFAILARRAASFRWWRIDWRPERLSATFHGRDLFAPVAAMLARGKPPPGEARPAAELLRPDWPDDLPAVLYVDGFGNAMTGLRAAGLAAEAVLGLGEHRLRRARTFSDAAPGEAFWFENANGLAEIAVNQGRACDLLGLAPGTPVRLCPP
jgi:S-adenosyl-L-methionine hydrolase (adenosine-forming)